MIERLLIVGLGSIGSRHVRLARMLMPGIKIVALRHGTDSGNAIDGIDQNVTSIEEALSFRPQAAVIANPAPFHVQAAMPLAKAGVHLLIEKPLSISTESIAELIATCRKSSCILAVGYNMRFSRSLQNFRTLLHEGKCGRILSVRAEVGQFLPSWRPQADYRGSVSARSDLGGGVLLELSHEIDYLRWVFGEVGRVTAVTRRQSDLVIDVEDTAHLLLEHEYAPGESGTVTNLSVDFIRQDTTRNCVAIGTTGTMRWNALTGEIFHFAQGDNKWETMAAYPAGRDDSYLAEWQNFIDSIAGTATPMVSGTDGLAVMEIIEAARLSSELGKAISPAEIRRH